MITLPFYFHIPPLEKCIIENIFFKNEERKKNPNFMEKA